MKKTRRRYDREFKISILAELEAGKPLAQVAREYGIHPSLPCRWRDVLAKYTQKAFLGNGKKYKENENAPDQSKVTCLPYPNNHSRRGDGKKSANEIFRAIQFAFSKDPTLSIRRACQLHGISRSGYYKWKNRTESATSTKAQDIDLKIKEIVQKFPEFGYRRVTKELKRRGYVVNHKRVLRVMHDTILL